MYLKTCKQSAPRGNTIDFPDPEEIQLQSIYLFYKLGRMRSVMSRPRVGFRSMRYGLKIGDRPYVRSLLIGRPPSLHRLQSRGLCSLKEWKATVDSSTFVLLVSHPIVASIAGTGRQDLASESATTERVIGFLGGGQLGRMASLAAVNCNPLCSILSFKHCLV